MSDRCLDARFERMIHHYELGLLSEEDRRAFELHLYDCDYCFRKAADFAGAARLMRHDPDVRAGISWLAEEDETAPVEEHLAPSPRRLWPRAIPVLVVAAALLLLLFRPWHVEVRPTWEAQAHQNRLAILDFTDLSGDSTGMWIGSVAANLLITDLSESHFVQVVSRQRLLDIEKLRPGAGGSTGLLDESAALQLAREADARWLLTGTVIQVRPRIVLSVQLIDVRSGDAVAGRRAMGDTARGIFPLIDQLSQDIKTDLALPPGAQNEPDPSVADLTTHSPEAYSYYLEGLELLDKFYRPEAAANFERALSYDSTLAMAYYYLSDLGDQGLIDRAVEYIDRVGQKEKYYIRSRKAAHDKDIPGAIAILKEAIERFPDEKEAQFVLGRLYFYSGRYEEAAAHFNTALQLDLLYKPARNHLVYTYDRMGRYEDAIATINTYISLAPGEPNPYDTRGEIYAQNGRYDLAIESFREALAIEPTFSNSRVNLGYIFTCQGEYDSARAQYEAVANAGDARTRANGRLLLPTILMRQGRLKEALRELGLQIAADVAEQEDAATCGYRATKHFFKASCYAERGDWEHALPELQEYVELFRRAFLDNVDGERSGEAQFLAESGAIPEAEAVADSLRTILEAAGRPMDPYWYAVGSIELAKGRPVATVDALEKIANPAEDFGGRYLLARAYLEAARLPEAVHLLEHLLSRGTYYRAYLMIPNTKMHYLLGLAYEKSNWLDKAAAQYEVFLKIWENADKDLAAFTDAQSRLTRLRSGS